MTEIINLPEIKLGSPGEEISKKDLHAISQRFKNLHLFKLQRIQQFLRIRQHVFLDLLALIFHQNHPLLPGFISLDTPMGIPDYSPGRQALKAAKTYTRNFKYKRRAAKNYAIDGLFLMGSVSSVAFTKSSDFDIWLCHDENLSVEALTKLQSKATAVESWAATLGLEVHFFLINSVNFKKGEGTPISVESSGKTQHYLLLEEFYRTAIYVAGKVPAWWLVPPEQEKNYTTYVKHLQQKRFVSEHEIIDFGGLNEVPVEEFISATLWHIYKAIYSPHKSLLKLLLMESYASEFPNPKWLCQDLKQAIYSGQFIIDDLDPYLLIYRKLDNYLRKSNDEARLDLVRKCLYLKIMGHFEKNADLQTREIREAFLQNIALRWQWPESSLLDLGRNDSWNIVNALQEHRTVVRQLTQCYQMIIGFAKKHLQSGYQKDEDSKLIGRKLAAFLEKKPDKVELIATRSTIQAIESEVSIIEFDKPGSASVWGLFLGKKTNYPSIEEAIKVSWSLIELLAWMVVNGLYHKGLKIKVMSFSMALNASEIQLILNQIDHFQKQYFAIQDKSLDIYRKRKMMAASLVIINVGVVLPESREDGRVVMSQRSDALSYGTDRENFIYSLDRISLNSWGEIVFDRFYGVEGLFNCLKDIINKANFDGKAAKLELACHTQLRANSIILRLKIIYQTLFRFYSSRSNSERVRYILPSEQSYYLFHKENSSLDFYKMDSEEQILRELGKSYEHFSLVHFDNAVLEHSVIPFLYSLNKANKVQVFCFSQNESIDLYVIDEKGALFFQTHEQINVKQLFSAYSVFFDTVLNKQNFDNQLLIEYSEVFKNSAGFYSNHRYHFELSEPRRFLNIRVSGIEADPPKINFTIYCNDIEFSTTVYGDQLFAKVAEHVVQLRQKKEIYPVYITDLDVPPSVLGLESETNFQTIRYLQYKQKIENRLNLYFS